MEAELVLSEVIDMEGWKVAWEKTYRPKLLTVARFSPQYEDFWTRIWSKYDELKAMQPTGIDDMGSSWQSTVEEYRDKINSFRKAHKRPASLQDKDNWPLWYHSKSFSDSINVDRVLHWRATLDNWNEMERMYSSDPFQPEDTACARFGPSLSQTQRSSYIVLKDWQTARYVSKTLPDAAFSFLSQQRDSKRPNPSLSSRHLSKAIKADESYYHQLCFNLLLQELNPRVWEPHTSWQSMKMLERARFYTGLIAASQALSPSFSLADPHEAGLGVPRVVPPSKFPDADQEDSGSPRWLWDVKRQETISVSRLPSHPPYTCVSHTWGRWRKSSSTRVRGVNGWLVPENRLYDVATLPGQLRRLPFKFVWLDLFCIPQDGSPEGDREILNQTTIFRRAESTVAWIHDVDSWDNLHGALRWLCLEFMRTAHKAGFPSETYIDPSQEIHTAAQNRVELMRPKGGNTIQSTSSLSHSTPDRNDRFDERLEPSTWFSSLWTLQEAVLHPEMELYSRDWKRLEDPTGLPVTLLALTKFLHVAGSDNDELFSFNEHPMTPTESLEFPSANQSKLSTPAGSQQLLEFMEMTRLDHVLLSASAVSILFNASVRRAKGSRALAIMSAIGVTDWYAELLQHGKDSRDGDKWLVLEQFPLEFVREACRKSGAAFFESSLTETPGRSQRKLRLQQPVGSMLPFFNSKGWAVQRFGPPVVHRVGIDEHASVAQWTVQEDGTVRICSAGVLFSSQGEEPARKWPGSILWFETGADSQGGLSDDCYQLLGRDSGGRKIHAVALYKDGPFHHGILLQQSTEGSAAPDGSALCIRVGLYWVEAEIVAGNPGILDRTVK